MTLYDYLEVIMSEEGSPVTGEHGTITRPPTREWVKRRELEYNTQGTVVGYQPCIDCEETYEVTLAILSGWSASVDRYNARYEGVRKARKMKVRPLCESCTEKRRELRRSRRDSRRAELHKAPATMDKELALKLLEAAATLPPTKVETLIRTMKEG